MVLLEETFIKLCSKMEDHLHIHHHNHHDNHHDRLLESFTAKISNKFDRLISTLNPESQSLPLPWILNCFKLLTSMHGLFANLAEDLEYRWVDDDDDLVEDYLQHSLNLLELFNSVSSALSHLGQSRIVLSHALALFQENPSSFGLDRLKPISPQTHVREFSKDGKNHSFSGKEDPISTQTHIREFSKDGKKHSFSGKEAPVSKALTVMESVGFWVSGVVLSALSGDPNPYTEMRKWAVGSGIGSLIDLDSRVEAIMLQKGGVFVSLVAEINGCVCDVASAIEGGEEEDASCRASDLGSKLEGLEVLVEELGKEVDGIFSEVMKSRNELIDCLRIDNQPWKQLNL